MSAATLAVSESVLARIAQRVGVIPGIAFRITRASILKAAEAGNTSEEILVALEKASSKPIPQNVRREISDWVASVRRATVRSVRVIECADEEAAARIRILTRAKLRELSPTVFELPETRAAVASTIKMLRDNGVFVQDVGNTEKAPKPGKRGRGW